MNRFLKIFISWSFLLLPGIVLAQNKTITIQGKNIPLKDIFEQIEKQTGYSIAFNQSEIDLTKQVSISLNNADIDKALSQVLMQTPYSFKINGYHVIIIPGGKDHKDKNQPLTQSIRGIVFDASTGLPIQDALVRLLNSSSGTTTDSLGSFKLTNIQIGRYDLSIHFIGYTPFIFREVLVTSSKEVYLEIPLKENRQVLNEIEIRPDINKEEPLNNMVVSGGRMLSVEEASRYAGGMDDPARLVTSFAGVAGSYATNAISIHGNAPQAAQWKLEGVEIPNPTHYADMVGLGGGIFSALSSQVMGNSDFYNGAFPAEYSNALAGVFDMFMRTGNNQHYQHTFQAGLLGIDLASEGPLSKKDNSSYIFNYRYSSTGLVTGTDLRYQDFSFKLNFPTRKSGTFNIWGLGLIDKINASPEDSSNWETYSDREDVRSQLYKAAGGINHKYTLSNGSYFKTSIAGTFSGIKQYVDQVNNFNARTNVVDISNDNWDIVFNSYFNKKFNQKHINRTGITITGLLYHLNYNISPDYGLDKPAVNISKGDGKSIDIAAFSESMFSFNQYLTGNMGITAHYFKLNNDLSIEPRLGLKWKSNPNNSFAIAFGVHSRREKLDYYFVEVGNKKVNTNLMLSKAYHLTFTYNSKIAENMHLKIEPYFQFLFDVPVEANSAFSTINYDDYYLDRALINKGKGRNYGIDITLEHYLSQGYYYLLTGSVFKSEYKGGDNKWRNTRLDRNYIINALGGKEWLLGKKQNKIFGMNIRLTFQGGDRYTPINEQTSLDQHLIEYDVSKSFTEQYKPSLNGDLSISYKINRKAISHEIALKILNVGGYTGQHGYQYNEQTGIIEKKKVMGSLVNLSYKIEF
jgi:hypothetical protein